MLLLSKFQTLGRGSYFFFSSVRLPLTQFSLSSFCFFFFFFFFFFCSKKREYVPTLAPLLWNSFGKCIGCNGVPIFSFCIVLWCSYPTTLDKKKKEPSPRFAARRTLFYVWYHARSRVTSAEKSRGQPWMTLPWLIACDQPWYHKIEQCSSRRESQGWFFF